MRNEIDPSIVEHPYSGMSYWKNAMLDHMVCPKCTGEASRDTKKETGLIEQ